MPFSGFNEATLRQILQQFFETSFNAIVITTAEPGYPIVYANPEFCRMTGYALDELIGQTPKIFQGEKTNRKILSRLKATVEAGGFFHGATTNYRKDGQPYPVEWNISPLRDDAGNITHYLSIQKDLSALKGVVSRLKNTNEHFRGFLGDIARAVQDDPQPGLNDTLKRAQQEITQELLDNSRLYSPALRSSENIDLFDEGEFFDCANDLTGMLGEEIEMETLSAEEYARQRRANTDMVQLSGLIDETQSLIDLLPYSKDVSAEMVEIGQNLHDIANEVFYFDDFVGIASVLAELATYTHSHSDKAVNPVVIETYRGLMSDLETWVQTVFIDKSAENIHELDASIISSARQLLMFLQ